MTTTTERLLQLAAEHEQKAQALRLAASELNGHHTQKKQTEVAQVFEGAIKLRKQQRRLQPPTQRATGEDKENRARLLRLFILHEAHTSKEISTYLTKQGYPIGRDRVRQLIATMPEVQRVGKGIRSKWVMATAKVKRNGQPSQRERERNAGLANARIVAGILQQAGRPMPIRELSQLARQQGLKGLTGIHNYVKQGFISRASGKKGRYSFKAMPPSASVPSAVSAD